MISAIAGLALTILSAPPTRTDTITDSVFVASNRLRSAQRFTNIVTDSLWYGVYVVRVVVSGTVRLEVARLQVDQVDSVALDEGEWRRRLQAAAQRDTSAEGATLLFVHGYSSNPATAINQGVQVKIRGDHAGPLVLFLWPANDRSRAVRAPLAAYHEDADAAAKSSASFAQVIREVHDAAPGAVLIAHSMGTRIALEAIVTDSAMRARLVARPLRAIGIFSPDVGADRFRAEFAPVLPALGRRIAMYGATTDYLLGASALVNRERRASGITVHGASLPGIELIDDTRGARGEPAIVTLVSPRHGVRWASAALADFFDVVVAGAPASCRVAAGAADSVSDGRWRLKPGLRPIAALLADCLR
jgi:esterase/lipase superfamily enzyme